MNQMNLQRPKTIFVDFDGTLYKSGDIDAALVAWLRARKEEGYELTLWSMAGAERANGVVERAGLSGLFARVITKPGFIVDDQGWKWTAYTMDATEVAK